MPRNANDVGRLCENSVEVAVWLKSKVDWTAVYSAEDVVKCFEDRLWHHAILEIKGDGARSDRLALAVHLHWLKLEFRVVEVVGAVIVLNAVSDITEAPADCRPLFDGFVGEMRSKFVCEVFPEEGRVVLEDIGVELVLARTADHDEHVAVAAAREVHGGLLRKDNQ